MEPVKLKNTETYANCEQGKYNAVVTKYLQITLSNKTYPNLI